MSSSLPPYEPQPSYLRSLMHDYHQQINAQTDATVADLQQRWVAARAAINADIARLQQQMETAIANGDQITYAWLADAQRLAALKASVEGNIAQFADATRQLVADGQLSALDLGTNAAQEALAATVPPGLSYTFGVPPADVLHAQAGALSPTSPLTALFAQMGPEAAKSAQAALFTSVALGEGPRAAATRLFWNTNLPRQRAEVIARTEILRSWRGAQMENYRANSDVVSGWQWSADFSDRTCFPAGTLIQTRRGLVPIEFVHAGDEALTHTGRYQPVLDVMAREYTGEMVILEADNYQVTATPEHPFLAFPTMIPDMSALYLDWISAANLAVGQTVACHAEYGHFNHLATIASMTTETASGTVYNLEVERDHSYIANGFVVHNCGACIALDGTIHTLDEDLDDHIMGRCSALPITRPWSDILAGTGADTSGLTETSIASWDSYLHGNGFASDWFEGLAPEVQNSILGPAKAEAYRAGDITLNDLAGVRRDPMWGDSIQEVSLKQLGLDAQEYLAAARANGTDSVVADAEALAQAQAGTPAAMAEQVAADAAKEAEQVKGGALPFSLEQFASATLEPLDDTLAGVNDAYTTIIDGQNYLIKTLTNTSFGVDDQGALSADQYQARAEAAAVQIGQIIGTGDVTIPTYQFDFQGEAYIATPYLEGLQPWGTSADGSELLGIPEETVRDMVLHNYLIGETDAHYNNFLYNPLTNEAYSIDHSLSLGAGAVAPQGSDGAMSVWTMLRSPTADAADHQAWLSMAFDPAQLQQIVNAEPQVLDLMRQQGLDVGIPSVQARFDVLRTLSTMPNPTYSDLYYEGYDAQAKFDQLMLQGGTQS